jgi:hypothetical protein
MAHFRDVLVAEMDAAIFEELADDVEIDGAPARGMFSAPWLQPEIGRLKTGLIEPRLEVRDGDAAAVKVCSIVVFDGHEYEVVSIEPDGTGITTLVLRPCHE